MRWISCWECDGSKCGISGIGRWSGSLEWFYGEFGKQLVFVHHAITLAYSRLP